MIYSKRYFRVQRYVQLQSVQFEQFLNFYLSTNFVISLILNMNSNQFLSIKDIQIEASYYHYPLARPSRQDQDKGYFLRIFLKQPLTFKSQSILQIVISFQIYRNSDLLIEKTHMNSLKLSSIDVLGEGASSTVYSYFLTNYSTPIALKVMRKQKGQLLKEYQILSVLQQHEGFPLVYGYSSKESCAINNKSKQFIAMQELGSSLKCLIKQGVSKLQTANIGIQMIERIQILHRNRYIHLDIKPENFLFGSKESELEKLYLIDFDMAQSINNTKLESTNKFRGNIWYSSVNQMMSSNISYKDDLQSIVYILGEMIEGKLPWEESNQHLILKNRRNTERIFKKVLKCKRQSRWGKHHEWVREALRLVNEQEQEIVYNKLKAWVCRLLE